MNSRRQLLKATALPLLIETMSRFGVQATRLGSGSFRIGLSGPTQGKTLQLRVYSGEGQHFSLRKSDEEFDVIAFIWDADGEPKIFLLTFSEAIDVLGEEPQETKSWVKEGYYRWSSATGLPKERERKMLAYKDRWTWLQQVLSKN